MAQSRDAITELDPLGGEGGFHVSLSNFDGPFDLLLRLISKHEMDITEVSLSAVTNEFIAYLAMLDPDEELEQASEFLVVAATLLDMKVAGLLPQGELVDEEAVAVLEARDLLFARLLQYRAFKEVSAWFDRMLLAEGTRHPRSVRLDEVHRPKPSELVWNTPLADFAGLAMLALAPKTLPTFGLTHLHAPRVSVREQAAIVVTRLRHAKSMSFRELIADAHGDAGVVVARFISILELYRHAAVAFEQLEPLGELHIAWSAEDWNDEKLDALGDEYEQS